MIVRKRAIDLRHQMTLIQSLKVTTTKRRRNKMISLSPKKKLKKSLKKVKRRRGLHLQVHQVPVVMEIRKRRRRRPQRSLLNREKESQHKRRKGSLLLQVLALVVLLLQVMAHLDHLQVQALAQVVMMRRKERRKRSIFSVLVLRLPTKRVMKNFS